ncbi:MAG: TonB-dependent receptor [Bacteroidetes bacterium]|jgi:iron complex outermembrane receptor protein|nr:TonB-dependent receptor [Bacteroidota bacterium]
MRKKIILLFFFININGLLKAQMMQVEHDSVVIKDNRMQMPLFMQNRDVTILDSKQIESMPVKSVNELLASISGIDLRQRGPWGGQADVSMDGSTFDQVLVLINGIKLSDSQTGHNMLNLSLPLSVIDHIEILRGPAARVYGVNALAGAINIVTRIPNDNEAFVQINSGSSFQKDTSDGKMFMNAGVQPTLTLITGKTAQTLSAEFNTGNGYRYNTGFNNNKFFYQNQTTIGTNGKLNAMGAYSENHFGANGYYSAPRDVESEETVQTVLGSLDYSYRHERWKIMPRLSYRYNKDHYIFIRQRPEVYQNIHESNTVTGELHSSYSLRNGKLGAGAEWRSEQINSSNLGNHNRNNIGLYAEYRHLLFQKLSVSGGAYVNYNSDYSWQFFPGIDAGYWLTKNIKLFSSFNTGQRLPTYTDLYYRGPLNIGNSNLKPELSNYFEAGVNFSRHFYSVKGSYFYRHTSEFIDWVRAADTLPWQPQNFQVLNTSGWTLQTSWHSPSGWLAAHHAGINLSYTYLNQNVQASDDMISKYAIEILRHQLIGNINISFVKMLDLSLSGKYQKRVNGNEYTIADLRLSYQWKVFQIYADCNNIFDTQYKEIGTIQMPGRWMSLGVRFNSKFSFKSKASEN